MTDSTRRPRAERRSAGAKPTIQPPTYEFVRTTTVPVSPALAFEPIRRIGGDRGWYYADWLWRLRGAFDLLVGGNGFRKGRRDPDHLQLADTVDCMRVVAFEPDRRVLFAVEMKIAGGGYLEFLVEGDVSASRVRLRALYDPEHLIGRIYWYLSYPFHVIVFRGLLRRLTELATSSAESWQRSGR